MASGPEHYREAEKYLKAWKGGGDGLAVEETTALLLIALAHATLAHAAATALGNLANGMPRVETIMWTAAAGTKLPDDESDYLD